MLHIKKRTAFFTLLLIVLLAIGGVFLLPRRDYRITQANCDKIKAGMSMREVEAILGPPGDYTAWPRLNQGGTSAVHCLWWGEDGVIVVQIGKGDLIESAVFVSREYLFDSHPRRMLKWFRDRLAR
jgi:hypothetical protein